MANTVSDPYLPTDRVRFEKQTQLLLSYAALAETGYESIANTDLAKVIDIHPNTASLANSFFYKIGFIVKAGNGYMPSDEVIQYKRALDYGNRDAAGTYLAPLVAIAWFWRHLQPFLSLRPSIAQEEAIEVLAQAASAGKDDRNRVVMLLDYLEHVGLITRENNQIQMVKSPKGRNEPTPAPVEQEQPVTPVVEAPRSMPAPLKSSVMSFQQQARGMKVSVEIDLDEWKGWNETRIEKFFAGIAQSIAQVMDVNDTT